MKVYLSKSKNGDFDSLMKCKSMLKEYDMDLLEFEGGTYTTDKLDSSDVVLVMPPELPKPYTFDFNVGKGQYEEIVRTFDCGIIVYAIIVLGDEIYVSEIEDAYANASNDWKLNYARIDCVEDTTYPLSDFIEKKVQTNQITEEEGNMLLLACSSLYN